MLVVPSPKFHCQEVGLPADVSVNCTDWPVTGELGLKVKEAVSDDADITAMDWLPFFEPEPLLAIRETM